MKRFITAAILALSLSPAVTQAAKKDHHETRIIETKIHYARALRADSNNFPVYMAAIGGQIIFEGGHPPVYATIKLGGQIYTVTTDKEGYYSAFVFTNGYNEFTVEGWSSHEPAGNKPQIIAEGVIK